MSTLRSFVAALAQTEPGFVGAALAVYLGSFVLIGARCRLLVGAMGYPIRLGDAVLAHLCGMCVNNLTPTSRIAGEAARIAFIRTRAGVPIPETTAAVTFERLSEIPPIALLIALAGPALTERTTAGARVALAASLVLMVIFALAAGRLRHAARAWLTRRFGWDHSLLVSRGAMLAAMLCSILVWIQDVLRLMLVAAALGVSLGLSRAAMLSVVMMVGGWAPTIGGLGAIEGGLVGGLMLGGVPLETAAAITVVERGISLGFGTCTGAVAMACVGVGRWRRRSAVVDGDQTTGLHRKNHTANPA